MEWQTYSQASLVFGKELFALVRAWVASEILYLVFVRLTIQTGMKYVLSLYHFRKHVSYFLDGLQVSLGIRGTGRYALLDFVALRCY